MKKHKYSNLSLDTDKFSRESLHREWNILKFAWQMADRFHFLLLVVMIMEVIIGTLPAVAIYFFQDAVSSAGHDILNLVTKENFMLIILFLFIYLLLQKGVSLITTFAIIDVEYNIRMKYLSKILAFPIDTISDNLDNRAAFSMTRETSMTSGLIPMIYRSFLRAPVTIISAVILLLVISARMVALVTIMMIVIVGVSLLMRRKLKQFHREQYDATSSLLQYFNEWLTGHRIYHVYGTEDFYEQKMKTTFDKISQVSKRHKVYGTAQSVLVEILTYIAIILFIVFLSDSEGFIDIGIVISFPAVMLLIRGEILKLVGGYQQLATTESSVTRLQSVLQMEAQKESGHTWNEQVNQIELRNVSYWYDSHILNDKSTRIDILNHTDLILSQGRINVITGPNGTGKSTTVNLILGLLKPKIGSIYYNQKDIKDYTVASLLSQFAIVEQEPFIFQGSLLDNITLGRNIPEEVILKYLHDFALDYLLDDSCNMSLNVGARGRALSSGEKQRLALIRALIGNPSVIILDEPTSNIDYETSVWIGEFMINLAKQHLVICISHDPVIVSNKDFNLFQIKDGKYIQPLCN